VPSSAAPSGARGSGALRRGLVCAGTGFTLLACSWHGAPPLPPLEELAEPPPLDAARLRVEARELVHPLLQPLEIDLSDGLSPEEAAVLAVLVNPDLVAVRDTHGEADAQLLAAGLLPNPVLGAELDNPYGAGSRGLTTAANLAASLDTRALLTLPARRRAARANLEKVDLGIAWQEWQVAEAARLEAERLGWLERRVAVVSQELALEQETNDRLERAVASGDATLEQLGVQRAAAEAVRRSLIELEQAQATSRNALLTFFGQPTDPGLRIASPVPASPLPVPAVDAIVPDCLARRLDIEALRRGVDEEDARLRQAILEQFPDVTLGITRNRDETSLKFLGGLVSVGLPVFDWNQGGVALERATRARLGHEYQARITAVRAAIDGLVRLLEIAARRLPEVEASIPRLAEIEAAEREAATRGDVDWLSYQTVRLALLDQRLEALSLAQAQAEARVGLDTECGGMAAPPAPGGRTP
jgi:cobalt-zinc-cadmium efflux system outer membrane protein